MRDTGAERLDGVGRAEVLVCGDVHAEADGSQEMDVLGETVRCGEPYQTGADAEHGGLASIQLHGDGA